MSSQHEGIAQIGRLASRVEARLRLARSLRAVARTLCAALLASTAALALRKVGALGELPARALLLAAASSVGVAGVVAWVWRLPDRAGARLLDRFHGLHDRLSSALAFAAQPASAQTPFMKAAIDDAIAFAPTARPALAAPILLPRELAVAGGLGGLLLAVALFEVRTRNPVASARLIDPLEMSADDLDDVKDFLKQIEQRDTTDETRATIEEFNKLVGDIADKRVDRTEAFRRMQLIEEKLATETALDRQAFERDLEAMGDAMKKAELTRPAGLALANDELAKARDALRDLAKKMRAEGTPVDKAKLDQMREALKQAAEQAQKNRAELEQRREQLADEILKMKQRSPDGGGSDEEQSLLRKKEAELDRLDRDLDSQRNAGRDLDRLDRELEKAAEDLMRDMGASAEDLEQGAEDLNRMDQQQMSQQEKEELRQKLEELRQLLRQQGQGGKGQIVRLQRFGRMARGQQGQGGGSEGNSGQDGQGQGGQGQGQGQSQGQGPGQGASGHGGQGGQAGNQGQEGQGGAGSQQGAGQGGETWIVGPNGEKILMLSRGQGQGSGQGQGEGGGQGEGQPGSWGNEHDPHLQGKATNQKMGTQDTQVQGADSAQGGSRSQVILGAAERGFASRGYRKVYTEYHQVAEESLGKDDIPGGYRFYVKRYFQLIRPRETP
jgi:hypothetical protein